MFTYNTMQSFIATCGMEPLHMVSPASEDPRRLEEFPAQLLDALQVLSERGIRQRDLVTPASLRNATLVAIAMGGSTNVVLHAPELARAAGLDFWREVITQEEFNRVSRSLPVLVNARPFGRYSMVDIDANGGLPAIVRELLDAGLLDGDCVTCTGETLAGQVARPAPADPRAVPSARYPDRADDRRPLLRRVGGAGHRARLARGGAGRADRAHRGRRHHRRGRQRRHPRLRGTGRRGDARRPAGAVA